MSTRLERRVLAKAASYQIQPSLDRAGTVFTNAGATGAITFTLPPPGQGVFGWWYRFRSVVAQNIVVATPIADTLLAPADAAASSVTSTVVGGEIEAVCLRNAAGAYRWAANGIAVGGTYTVQP